MTQANRTVQQQLVEMKQWNRGDVVRLVAIKSRGWQFADGVGFDQDALSAFEGEPNLDSLAFQNSDLRRENLLSLARMPSLRWLQLTGCRFRSDDFAAFCEELVSNPAPKLNNLWLADTNVDDDGLRALSRVERLSCLILSNTRVSDAGLKSLLSLKKLRTLRLDGTRVSDVGVLQLAPMLRLAQITALETSCASDIGEQLRRAQLGRTQSKQPLDAPQLEAANARLRAFLEERDAPEHAQFERGKAMRARYNAGFAELGPLYSVEENLEFARENGAQKAAIAERFCSVHLRQLGASNERNIINYCLGLPLPIRDLKWVFADTPTPTKTRFVVNMRPGEEVGFATTTRRYTLIFEAGDWFLDEIHGWNGGWKRSLGVCLR